VLRDGRAKAEADAAETLDMWEAEHHARIDRILAEHGFDDPAAGREAGQ
jgi:4-hydroxy-4-methyl-2-oxoglutarate aldolase